MSHIPSQDIAEYAVSSEVVPSARLTVTPFNLNVPQSALDDLKRRLEAARWPHRETVADWSQGVPLARIQALVEYWRTSYDWRRCEATSRSIEA